MASRVLTDAPRSTRWQRLPVSARIGILYVASRLVTTLFLAAAAALSGTGSRFGPSATIASLTSGWDAQWYWYLAVNGYPSALPLTSAGEVAENQWAFMPVYAYLAQVVGFPFGSWVIGSVIVSLVAGYLSCLVLYRLLRMRLDGTASMWAVLLFASGPLAAMFQVGYAESLFMLWLLLAIWCVMLRRWTWLWAVVPLLAFTRPGVLAFALFLGLYGAWRLWRRATDPFGVRDAVTVAALAVYAGVLGLSWTLVAAIVTGDPSAYLQTELAWRRNWISDDPGVFVPFHGFIEGAQFWFRQWGWEPWLGPVTLAAAVVVIAAALLFVPQVRRLGIEIRLWTASYLLYLLAVFFPQSSLFRLLWPTSLLFGALAVPRSTPWRVGMLGLCLAGQWWWIYNMYALGSTIWQIP